MSTVPASLALALLLAAFPFLTLASAADDGAGASVPTCARVDVQSGTYAPGPIVSIGQSIVVGVATMDARVLVTVTPSVCTPDTGNGSLTGKDPGTATDGAADLLP